MLNAYACQCWLGFELCEYVRLSLSNCKTIARVVKRTGSSERTVLILETLDVCDCLISSLLAKNVQPAAFLVLRVFGQLQSMHRKIEKARSGKCNRQNNAVANNTIGGLLQSHPYCYHIFGFPFWILKQK